MGYPRVIVALFYYKLFVIIQFLPNYDAKIMKISFADGIFA